MTATATNSTQPLIHGQSIVAGVLSGLVGGAVFGLMMAVMGMLPMVAMLVGSQSAAVGFLVHMAISAAIGGTYGLVAGRLPKTAAVGIMAGAVNGFVWWVLGALIMMPLMLGMTDMVLQIGQPQWMSLVGHLIFGVVAGLAFIPLSERLG